MRNTVAHRNIPKIRLFSPSLLEEARLKRRTLLRNVNGSITVLRYVRGERTIKVMGIGGRRVVKCYRCQDMAFVLGECLGSVELARLAEYYKLHK